MPIAQAPARGTPMALAMILLSQLLRESGRVHAGARVTQASSSGSQPLARKMRSASFMPSGATPW
eukprot:12450054-Alexandrium_andersonii.AAC.1